MCKARPTTHELNGAADLLPAGGETIQLVLQARAGNHGAVDALVQRALPSLRSWARGKLPHVARGGCDTGDLVQEAALHVIARRAEFDARHPGAMRAYLRRCVINRVRDELRRVARRPVEELGEDYPGDRTAPIDAAIRQENHERYRDALGRLREKDRELILARVEGQATFGEIADRFGLKSADAARMAVTRALQRLAGQARAQLTARPPRRRIREATMAPTI